MPLTDELEVYQHTKTLKHGYVSLTVGIKRLRNVDCNKCDQTDIDGIFYIMPICFHENHAVCFFNNVQQTNVFSCLICGRTFQDNETFSWDISYVK